MSTISLATRSVYREVIEFRFFLPLAHESALLRTLDRLFYADTLLQRLAEIDSKRLEERFPRAPGQDDAAYLDTLVQRIGTTFTGYSLSQVRGRFRNPGEPLETRQQAAERLASDRPYLVDETTSCVTFVFPCGPEEACDPEDFEELDLPGEAQIEAAATLEARQLLFLFHHLFVRAVLREVASETEVWLLENGMRQRLWKFYPARSSAAAMFGALAIG